MHEYYLSIVMRYGKGTHALFHMENGLMKKEEIYRFHQEPVFHNGFQTFDTDAIFQEILAGMKKCREIGKIPVSVGITGWGADYVLLDKSGKRCSDAIYCMDTRSLGMGEEVNKILPEPELFSMTGLQKIFFNTLYQLMADKTKSPERLENASHLLMLPDYFHYLLTGIMKTEYTSAGTTQLLDPHTKNWHYDLIHALGIPADIFCEIVPPGTTFSHLLPEIREEIGYDCKVTLPCTHDTASVFAALPANDANPVFIRADNYAFIGMEIPSALSDERSRKYGFSNQTAYRGFSYYKTVIGIGIIKAAMAELAPKLSMEEISKLADEAKIDSLIDLSDPRFMGLENIPVKVEDACRELGQTVPKTVGEFASVLFQSLAKIFANTISEAEKLTGMNATCIHILGTGQDAHYLNQLVCEETGLPATAGPTSTRLVGNAVVQMIHSGIFSDLKEARECIGRSFPIRSYQFHPKEAAPDEKIARSYHTAEIAIRCAKLLSGTRDYDFSLNQVLLEISRAVRPDRVTIIGTDHVHVSLLYEWVANDVPANIKYLQNLPYDSIAPWEKIIAEDGMVVQLIGETFPGTESSHEEIIRRNNIHNIVEAPLFDRDELIGYLGVENFMDEEVVNIQGLLETISFFVSAFMVNHRLVTQLKVLGNTDLLTGVLNRNAMNAAISDLNEKEIPVGVLYADVNGLKRINDNFGHVAGDALIKRAAGILMQVFDRQHIYRAGGDEFVVILSDIEENTFMEQVRELEQILKKAKEFAMAVGYRYTKTAARLDQTVREADEAMYENKQNYYREHRSLMR